MVCVVSRILSVIAPVSPRPLLPSLFGRRDRGWERLHYFLEAEFPSTALLPLWVRQFLAGGGGLSHASWDSYSIPGLYQLMQGASPSCDSQKCLQTLPQVPSKAKSTPAKNHWLPVHQLVFGGGGIWTERSVTPRVMRCFRRTPASFGRMKKQGGELIPWRHILLIQSKES